MCPSSERRQKPDSLAVHDRSVSLNVREGRIRQTCKFYRPVSTRDRVEKWLSGLVAPSSRERGKRFIIIENSALLTAPKKKKEAADQVYIPERSCGGCGRMTHTQKTQLVRRKSLWNHLLTNKKKKKKKRSGWFADRKDSSSVIPCRPVDGRQTCRPRIKIDCHGRVVQDAWSTKRDHFDGPGPGPADRYVSCPFHGSGTTEMV